MNKPKPFLKWAGGKRKLAQRILDNAGIFPGAYFEPFLGAGAVFFATDSAKTKYVNDSNPELINTYKCIRDNLSGVLEVMSTFKADKDSYLEIREMDRLDNFAKLEPALRAARFIYLNKTGYNGLHRVNSKGQFNVPFGSNSGNFIDAENLLLVSNFLKKKIDGRRVVKITCGDFVKATENAIAGDFVYLDPPYVPISGSSNFVAYSKNGFSEEDQLRVSHLFKDLVSRGVSVIASNSDTGFIREIYKSRGTKIETVSMSRSINSVGTLRGHVPEVLITNLAK